MIQKQQHEMCKINMKMNLYYANMCKHEHEKNMTRLSCKIMPKINVGQIERNERLYSYLYPFKDQAQGNFHLEAYMCAWSKEASWEPF